MDPMCLYLITQSRSGGTGQCFLYNKMSYSYIVASPKTKLRARGQSMYGVSGAERVKGLD